MEIRGEFWKEETREKNNKQTKKNRCDYKPQDYCNQHDYIWLDPSNKNSTNKPTRTHTPVCQRQSWLFSIDFPRGHLSPPTHTHKPDYSFFFFAWPTVSAWEVCVCLYCEITVNWAYRIPTENKYTNIHQDTEENKIHTREFKNMAPVKSGLMPYPDLPHTHIDTHTPLCDLYLMRSLSLSNTHADRRTLYNL